MGCKFRCCEFVEIMLISFFYAIVTLYSSLHRKNFNPNSLPRISLEKLSFINPTKHTITDTILATLKNYFKIAKRRGKKKKKINMNNIWKTVWARNCLNRDLCQPIGHRLSFHARDKKRRVTRGLRWKKWKWCISYSSSYFVREEIKWEIVISSWAVIYFRQILFDHIGWYREMILLFTHTW